MNANGTFKNYKILSGSSDTDKSVYCEVGPFAMNRQVVKELEGPIYDGAGYTWLIVKDGDKVIAISSLDLSRLDKGNASFGLTYVVPEYRRQGIYRHLFAMKLALCRERGAKTVKGLANPLSAILFEENKFDVTSERGKWKHYEKEII